MFSSFQIKLVIALLFIGLALASYFLLRSNIILRHQAKITANQIAVMATRYDKTQKMLLDVEKAKDEETQKADKAMAQIYKDGYVVSTNGDNPEWMRSK